MKSEHKKRLLPILFISISFGILIFISHSIYSPNFPEQIKGDLAATQTERNKPILIMSPTNGLGTYDSSGLFATPINTTPNTSIFVSTSTSSPFFSINTFTPTPTLDAYQEIWEFLAQTKMAETPSFDNPMAMIELYATQTSIARTAARTATAPTFNDPARTAMAMVELYATQTSIAYTAKYLTLEANVTPSATSTKAPPTKTPNSIFMTLTANSDWQTAQVATIRATAYPAMATAAANLKGTATSLPTATIVPTPTLQINSPSYSNPNSLFSLLVNFDFDDFVFYLLVWLFPSFISVRVVEKIKRRSLETYEKRSEISFLIFYVCGISLSLLNDFINTEYYILDLFDTNIAGLIELSVFLGVLSLLSIPVFVEMSKGFDIVRFSKKFFSDIPSQENNNLGEKIKEHFLNYGIGIVVFWVFLGIYLIWNAGRYYFSALEVPLMIGVIAYFYILIIEAIHPENNQTTWERILNPLILPIVGIIRAISLLFMLLVFPTTNRVGWWFILLKYSLALMLPFSYLDFFISGPENTHLLLDSLANLSVKIFFLPLFWAGKIVSFISNPISRIFDPNGLWNTEPLQFVSWLVSSFLMVIILAWLFESISRALPSDQSRTLHQLSMSDLTKMAVDIFTGWYLVGSLIIWLLAELSSRSSLFYFLSDNSSDSWTFFLFTDVLLAIWAGRYVIVTIKNLGINWKSFKWHSVFSKFFAAFLAWPILALGRMAWKVFSFVLTALLYISLVLAFFIGTFPDVLARENLPFSPTAGERLISIVHNYDFLVRSIASGSYSAILIITAILVVFVFWVTWGVYLKYRSIGSENVVQAIEVLFSTFMETLSWSISATIFTFIGLRFINILLFILPGISSNSIWIILIYDSLAVLLFIFSFSRLLFTESKAVLMEAMVAPLIWLTSSLKTTDRPFVVFDAIKKIRVEIQHTLQVVNSVFTFLFLPYPINRGRFKIRLPGREQHIIRYSIVLSGGFYFEQSVLFMLIVIAASSFSPVMYRNFLRVFVFALLLFVFWFYTKQTYEEGLYKNSKLLARLIGVSFIAFPLAWVLWNIFIPLIYMLLLAITAQNYFDFVLVHQWLQNNPPFPYFKELIFLAFFIAIAHKILYRMWDHQFAYVKRDLGRLSEKFILHGLRPFFNDLWRIVRHPRNLPDNLPKSFLLVFGMGFYSAAYLLVLLVSSLIYPSIYSPLAIAQKILSLQGALLLVIPVVAFIASNPVMYIKSFFPLVVGEVERFNKQANFSALNYFVSKPLLFSGYRKSIQDTFLSLFFAYGLACLIFEPVRVFLWQFPGWSAFILLAEILCSLILGSLLMANFVRIIPLMAVMVGTTIAGISLFAGAAASPYLVAFALITFMAGLGDYSAENNKWFQHFSSLESGLRYIMKFLFDLDVLEFSRASFSNLILFEGDDSTLETSQFREQFETAVEKLNAPAADVLAALPDPAQDPIRQSLILYAYSDFDGFLTYARNSLFPPPDKTVEASDSGIQAHVWKILSHLYLVSLQNLDAVLKAVISLRKTRPQATIDVSPIHLSDFLTIPFEQNARYVVDFSAEERDAIETYLNGEKSVSELMKVWVNFVDESLVVKELYSLYQTMTNMSLVNRIDEIATFSLSMRNVVISPESVHMDLYQVLLKIANIADIVARASVQRPGHRAHEYSFALKQLQVVQTIHLPKLVERERKYLLEILDLWAKFITESLIYEPTQPHLSVSIETTQLSQNVEETLVIVIANEGDSTALDVQINLSGPEALTILSPGLPVKVDEILGNSSARLEFNVVLHADEDVNLGIEMGYVDVRQKQYLPPEIQTVLRHATPGLASLSFDDNIANPYVYGPAVTDPDHFFGRQKTLLAIEQRLRDTKQASIIMLFGQRRMGKSSILKKVHNLYSQMSDWWPIYIDGATIFAKQVPDLMLALAVRIWSRLPEGHSLPSPDLATFQGDPGHALVDQFLPSVNKVITENGKSLLILFDEFDTFVKTAQARFKHEDVQEVLWVIREFAQGMSTGGFIYAGTYELLDLSRFYKAPLFNLAEQIKIGPLDQNAARDLICVPGNRYLQFNEDAIQKIMRLSGCHPYFIQLLCNKVFDVAVNENKHIVGVSLLNKTLIEAQEQENAFFNIWSERSEDQRLTLSALAQIIEYDGFLAPVTRIQNVLELGFVSIDIDRIQNAVDRLVQEEILQKDNDLFGFTVDLLRLWIRARKSLPSVRAELDYRI